MALLVVGIGASPRRPDRVRDQPGPRPRAADRARVLPIRGKGGSDWGYSWVPVVGPLIGWGALGAFAFLALGGHPAMVLGVV